MNRFAGLRLLGPYLNPYRGRVALALLSLLVAASVLALVVQPRVTARAVAPGASARVLGGTGLVLWLGVALAACAFILLE